MSPSAQKVLVVNDAAQPLPIRPVLAEDLARRWYVTFTMGCGSSGTEPASLTLATPRPAIVDMVAAEGCEAGLLEIKNGSLFSPGAAPYNFQSAGHTGTPGECFASIHLGMRFQDGRVPPTPVIVPWVVGFDNKALLTVTVRPDGPGPTSPKYSVTLVGRFTE